MVSRDRAVVDVTIDPSRAAPAIARQAVGDRLGHHVRCGDVVVCVSEAVTNAVIHARSPVRLVAWEDGQVIRIEISDGDPIRPIVRAPDPDTVAGRGMVLIDRLADRWGVQDLPDGKTIWFEVTG